MPERREGRADLPTIAIPVFMVTALLCVLAWHFLVVVPQRQIQQEEVRQ